MAIVSDPLTYGFVASLSHPGGNLTGLSMVNTELSSKRIELLKEIAPGVSRIAVFTDPTMGPQGPAGDGSRRTLSPTTLAAPRLGLPLAAGPPICAELADPASKRPRGNKRITAFRLFPQSSLSV